MSGALCVAKEKNATIDGPGEPCVLKLEQVFQQLNESKKNCICVYIYLCTNTVWSFVGIALSMYGRLAFGVLVDLKAHKNTI